MQPIDEAAALIASKLSAVEEIDNAVEAEAEGDVLVPAFDETAWTEVSSEAHPAGEKDDHAFVFRVLERK